MAENANKHGISAVFNLEDGGSTGFDTLPTTTTTTTTSSGEHVKSKQNLFAPVWGFFKSSGAKQQQQQPTTSDFVEVGRKTPEKLVKIRTGSDDNTISVLASLFNIIVKSVMGLRELNRTTSIGRSKSVRDFFITSVLVLGVAYLLHLNAVGKINALKATEEELASCHVCLDTSVIPTPPCIRITEADFTTHKRKMKDLVSLMTDHINHDEDKCMASFHIGSKACAFAVKGRLSTTVYFNPAEIEAEWSKPLKKYEEPSDYFNGVTLKRERPSSILISHQVMTTKGELKNETIDMDGEYAAWVSHCLEVLNGTHHELYSRANKKQ